MNTNNKNLCLNALKNASCIDRLRYIYDDGTGPAISASFESITWGTATTGTLANSAVINFENTSGSTIQVMGIVLVNSTHAIGDYNDAIAYDFFGTTVNVADGEVLRIDTATYTIN